MVNVERILCPIDFSEASAVLPDEIGAEVRRFRARALRDSSPEIVVTAGDTAKEIVRLADKTGADLLVMGTHGRGGFEHRFGSTTHRIVREAPCPVLTLRAIDESQS
ncbi:MAG: universal stress protein [Cyanobacteria bacterium]|nr:universal stress protein [Cyanobacteriota bacterium]